MGAYIISILTVLNTEREVQAIDIALKLEDFIVGMFEKRVYCAHEAFKESEEHTHLMNFLMMISALRMTTQVNEILIRMS